MIKKMIGIMMGAAVLAAVSPAQISRAESVTVTDFGADGSDREDDRAAIQQALDTAQNSSGTTTVVVPAGTYHLSGNIRIHSNTNLLLNDSAVMMRDNEDEVMISNARSEAGGYSALTNVTISGGTWDGNIQNKDNRGYGRNAKNIMYFWHGKNIHIDNTNLKSVCGVHFIEFAAVSDSSVTDVNFTDFVRQAGVDYSVLDGGSGTETEENQDLATGVSEAIQLDIAREDVSSSSYPYDSNPCRNITVSGCLFDGCPSAVGNHHQKLKKTTTGLTIENNTFKNIRGFCVNLPNMTDVYISGNRAENVQTFTQLFEKSSAEMANNTITYDKTSKNGRNLVYVMDGSELTLKKNTLTGSGKCIVEGSNCTLSFNGNTIEPMSGDGSTDNTIYLRNCKYTFKNNTIKNSRKAAIAVAGSSTGSFSDNTITSSKTKAVSITGSSKGTFTGKNVFSKSGTFGVHIYGGSSATITGLQTKASGHSGVCVEDKSKLTIKNSKISGTGSGGIWCINNATLTAESNSIDGGKYYGIHVKGSTATLTKNTIKNCPNYSIGILNGSKKSSAILKKNTMYKRGIKREGTVKESGNVLKNGKKPKITISKKTLSYESAKRNALHAKVSATTDGSKKFTNVSPSNLKKYVKLSSKGDLNFKAGAPKGTYKVKVVTGIGKTYEAVTKTVSITIK